MSATTPNPTLRQWAPLILIGTAMLQYTGAGLAVQLFAVLDTGLVAWGRICASALLLLLIVRPRVWSMNAQALRNAAVLGIAMGGMNIVFYYAISYIPLGTAVSLEFLGPVILAALTGSGWRTRAGVVTALAGVFMISWVGVDLSDRATQIGVALSLLAGALWTTYVYVGRKLSVGGSGPVSLAVGMATAAVLYSPVGFTSIPTIFSDWRLVGLLLLVGLFSSVMPYGTEITLMKHVPTSVFALMLCLYPATSLLIGLVMLQQIPTAGEIIGLILISLAIALVSIEPKRKFSR